MYSIAEVGVPLSAIEAAAGVKPGTVRARLRRHGYRGSTIPHSREHYQGRRGPFPNPTS